MFIVGIELDSRAYFMTTTMLISLPTGCKLFWWMCTYIIVECNNVCSVSMCVMYVKLFVIMFWLGGTSGIVLGNNVVDVSLHDSYYVVSHFHMVLSIGTIISLILILSNNQEYIMYLVISVLSRLQYYQVYLINIGIVLTFIPLHYISFSSLPRRMLDFQGSING